jgi:hypothetical protein
MFNTFDTNRNQFNGLYASAMFPNYNQLAVAQTTSNHYGGNHFFGYPFTAASAAAAAVSSSSSIY